MGCNCGKNNTNVTPSKVKQTIVVENREVTIDTPNYTRDDLTRAKDYLAARNKTDEEKQFVVQLLNQEFGDVTPEYCDYICLNRMNKRIVQLSDRLFNYENLIKK